MAAKSIAQQSIQELIATADIVALIEQFVRLKRRGNNWHGLCPFHHEKTPSFSVNSAKQFYYCFGCQSGGNAIDFIMQHDSLSFPDAVIRLADIVGFKLVFEGNHEPSNKELIKDLFRIHALISDGFKKHFMADSAGADFLKKRGLTAEIAKRFDLGYAPNDSTRQFSFLKKSFSAKTIEASGLCGFNSNQRPYDRFRHRIMFPIRDLQGRTLAFGGRAIDDAQPAKYLNSPETLLFKKNKVVYGLFECLSLNRQPQRLVVVEGYMDVVMCHQAGFTQAVACLGTAFSYNHLQLLNRFTSSIVFCFDGDKAGMNASWKALVTCLQGIKDGIDIRFCHLPDGHDPDSYMVAHGVNSFEEQLNNAYPLDEYFFKILEQKWPLKTIAGQSGLLSEAKSLIEPMKNNFTKQLLMQRCEALTKVSIEPSTQVAKTQKPQSSGWVDRVVSYWVMNPESVSDFLHHDLSQWLPDDHRLSQSAQVILGQNNVKPSEILAILQSKDIAIDLGSHAIDMDAQGYLTMLNQMASRVCDAKIQTLLKQYKNKDMPNDVQKQIQELTRKKFSLQQRGAAKE
ncbi:MAG: DNA primase [Candidatus Comchoanobacterales bacterium]